MKSSEAEKSMGGEKKPEGLILSKKNLLELIEGKKMKSVRLYIEELKNSNPKAEKYIKEVLEEIFIQKKVTSASVYMYSLVFYKNLLISGELDYYEDNQFFPVQIHESIAKICEFNEKQPNVKSKGVEYFKTCVKVEINDKNKEQIQTLGVAVVIYAMELLQSMAEWYKEDYFTGEESHFYKNYKSYLKRGITFPKKSQYVYIKQQDQIEFQKNYRELFQQNFEGETLKPQDTSSINPNPNQNHSKTFKQAKGVKQTNDENSNLLQISNLESKVVKSPPQKQPGKKPSTNTKNQNLTEPKSSFPQSQTKNFDQSKKPNKSLQNQIKQAKIEQKTQIQTKNQQRKQEEFITKRVEQHLATGKKTQVQQKQKSIDNFGKKLQNVYQELPQKLQEKSKIVHRGTQPSKQAFSQINLENRASSIKKTLTEKEQSQEIMKMLKQSKSVQENNEQLQQKSKTLKKQPNILKLPENSLEKKQQSVNLVNPSPKKSFKRTEQTFQNVQASSSSPTYNKQQQFFISQPHQKNNLRVQVNQKRKHKIFQKAPRNLNASNLGPRVQEKCKNIKTSQNLNQVSSGIKVGILNSNFSFSPVIQTNNKYDSIKESPVQKKRSVPKTEKKYLDKTFAENQDLLFKLNLTQNFVKFPQNKALSQKFPMKTLSAWRCQKEINRDSSPENKIYYESLMEIVKKLKFKEITIPFIPEYFEPATLNMFGLRKSSLEIAGFSSTSQVFFNNKIIQARLMKPARNSYILSILNVSKLPIKISPADMKKVPHSNEIRIAQNGITPDSKTVVNSGCYIDIHFFFQTSNLNFKFLTFDLLIDDKILTLQLPISLLDQCQVEKGIQVENILSCRKSFAKIIRSEAFNMNKKEVPNFMKNKMQESQRSKIQSGHFEEQDFWSFTLRIKLEERGYVNTLNCCISSDKKLQEMYRFEIIFDPVCQETESFAKIMIELLSFLLWE